MRAGSYSTLLAHAHMRALSPTYQLVVWGTSPLVLQTNVRAVYNVTTAFSGSILLHCLSIHWSTGVDLDSE